eukprot:TRINITY_DN120986_c0_g1_i1.p1 TRINITY_DN120986_c0_g1~~TRINITY_DN120986_c0_g1_i1.p1  ORF type:complete len:294 (-),score=36.73 TRINITY_DN120986_c0_g1_i1:101-982(-)
MLNPETTPEVLGDDDCSELGLDPADPLAAELDHEKQCFLSRMSDYLHFVGEFITGHDTAHRVDAVTKNDSCASLDALLCARAAWISADACDTLAIGCMDVPCITGHSMTSLAPSETHQLRDAEMVASSASMYFEYVLALASQFSSGCGVPYDDDGYCSSDEMDAVRNENERIYSLYICYLLFAVRDYEKINQFVEHVPQASLKCLHDHLWHSGQKHFCWMLQSCKRKSTTGISVLEFSHHYDFMFESDTSREIVLGWEDSLKCEFLKETYDIIDKIAKHIELDTISFIGHGLS